MSERATNVAGAYGEPATVHRSSSHVTGARGCLEDPPGSWSDRLKF